MVSPQVFAVCSKLRPRRAISWIIVIEVESHCYLNRIIRFNRETEVDAINTRLTQKNTLPSGSYGIITRIAVGEPELQTRVTTHFRVSTSIGEICVSNCGEMDTLSECLRRRLRKSDAITGAFTFSLERRRLREVAG